MSGIVAIVLAAGRGTRMGSDRAKVLHELGGAPLVTYPIQAARTAGADPVVVVVGHQAPQVRAAVVAHFGEQSVRFALQPDPHGTGHAVSCALPSLDEDADLAFILSGDVPLLRAATLSELASACRATPAALAVATFVPPDPTGYGRIVRDAAGRVVSIVEERDASAAQRTIVECNAGTYAVSVAALREDLPRVGQANAQGEVYLTDLVALAAERGAVGTVQIEPYEAAGVNTPEQLAQLEGRLPETST
jgi:bifunctional UDP-N-acetylglucosamine pyrophosphorylase/glucosamine-1-phosphate N-acetyltransferase